MKAWTFGYSVRPLEHSAFDMEMGSHSHANKTRFQRKGCALGLILKVRVLTIPREHLHVKLIKLQKKVHKCVSYLELFKGNKAVSPVSCLSFGCTESTVRGNKQFKQRHFWAAYVNLSLINMPWLYQICSANCLYSIETIGRKIWAKPLPKNAKSPLLASHANVLSGSSHVPVPRTFVGQEHVTTPKNVCVGG